MLISGKTQEKLVEDLKRIERNFGRAKSDFRRAISVIEEKGLEEAQEILVESFTRFAEIPAAIYREIEAISMAKECAVLPVETASTSCISLARPRCFYETDHIFCCDLQLPAYMKSSEMEQRYADIISLEIQREVVKVRADNPVLFRSVSVIFVNKQASDERGRQPYFDNDNLSIKRILDSIISYVAFDDAACFCSNYYTYEAAETAGASVFVIEEGHLLEWARRHPSVKFASEILP